MKYDIEVFPDAQNLGLHMSDIARQVDDLMPLFPLERWEWIQVPASNPKVFDLEVRGIDGRKWKTHHVFESPSKVWIRFDTGNTEFTEIESHALHSFTLRAIAMVQNFPSLTKIIVKVTGS